MAADLIPVATALAHLREDAGVADDLVALYLSAAIRTASEYLNRELFANAEDMAAAVLADGQAVAGLLVDQGQCRNDVFVADGTPAKHDIVELRKN